MLLRILSKKTCTRHEEIIHLKKPHNIKTQLGNYTEATNETLLRKKKRIIIKSQLNPKISLQFVYQKWMYTKYSPYNLASNSLMVKMEFTLCQCF